MTQATAIEADHKSSRALGITRVLSGVTAAMVLVQGASAGSRLSGLAGALEFHRLGADALSLLSIAVVVAAAVAARHLKWPLIVAILGFLAIGMQVGMGFERQMQIHLPLGVALFGFYVALTLLIPNPEKT